jgi:hypothetical protein
MYNNASLTSCQYYLSHISKKSYILSCPHALDLLKHKETRQLSLVSHKDFTAAYTQILFVMEEELVIIDDVEIIKYGITLPKR